MNQRVSCGLGHYRCLALLLCAGFFASCTSHPSVHTAYDHRVDFGRYRSFALAHPDRPVPSPGGLDPFTVFRMRQMTFSVLASQGLEPAPYADAALHVVVEAGGGERTEVIPASTWGPYRPGYYYGSDVRTYEVIRLTVDLVDAATRAVVWHGQGELAVGSEISEDEMWRLVQGVMAEFPPGRAPNDS